MIIGPSRSSGKVRRGGGESVGLLACVELLCLSSRTSVQCSERKHFLFYGLGESTLWILFGRERGFGYGLGFRCGCWLEDVGSVLRVWDGCEDIDGFGHEDVDTIWALGCGCGWCKMSARRIVGRSLSVLKGTCGLRVLVECGNEASAKVECLWHGGVGGEYITTWAQNVINGCVLPGVRKWMMMMMVIIFSLSPLPFEYYISYVCLFFLSSVYTVVNIKLSTKKKFNVL